LKLENGISQRQVRNNLRQVQQQMMRQPYYKSLQIYYDVDPM
jgi:primosomal protein N' (replication factor Y)